MFLVALILLSVAVGLYVYLYMQTGTIVEKTLSDRSALRTAQATRVQGSEVVQLQQNTVDSRSKLRTFFVPSEDTVAFIKAVESVQGESGADVSLSALSAVAPTETNKIGRVSATVSVEGSWSQVMKALSLFESMPYDRKMNSLSMRSSGSKEAQWHASFSLVVGTIASK